MSSKSSNDIVCPLEACGCDKTHTFRPKYVQQGENGNWEIVSCRRGTKCTNLNCHFGHPKGRTMIYDAEASDGGIMSLFVPLICDCECNDRRCNKIHVRPGRWPFHEYSSRDTNQKCRNGWNCPDKDKGCRFDHVPEKVMCRYGDGCSFHKKGICYYSHTVVHTPLKKSDFRFPDQLPGYIRGQLKN